MGVRAALIKDVCKNGCTHAGQCDVREKLIENLDDKSLLTYPDPAPNSDGNLEQQFSVYFFLYVCFVRFLIKISFYVEQRIKNI